MNSSDSGFSMLIEEVAQARALGASFDEVPYTLTSRKAAGGSKFVYSLRVYWSYLRHLMRSPKNGMRKLARTRDPESRWAA
jgi:hypothetical protein